MTQQEVEEEKARIEQDKLWELLTWKNAAGSAMRFWDKQLCSLKAWEAPKDIRDTLGKVGTGVLMIINQEEMLWIGYVLSTAGSIIQRIRLKTIYLLDTNPLRITREEPWLNYEL
jgi:hypothetical protein